MFSIIISSKIFHIYIFPFKRGLFANGACGGRSPPLRFEKVPSKSMCDHALFDLSGQIRMASRRKVKNGQKLKKKLFFPIKNMVVEMSPIGMIQETQKKHWNKWRRGVNRQKTAFVWFVFLKIFKNPKQNKRLMTKQLQKWSRFFTFWGNHRNS